MLVILLSACTAPKATLPLQDLNHFQIDCSRREEQLKFLQSLRISSDDKLRAGVENVLTPWRVFTDPAQRTSQQFVFQGNINWTINQLLLKLSRDC